MSLSVTFFFLSVFKIYVGKTAGKRHDFVMVLKFTS